MSKTSLPNIIRRNTGFEGCFSLLSVALAVFWVATWRVDLTGKSHSLGVLIQMEGEAGLLEMAMNETTVAQYCRYLNHASGSSGGSHPQCRVRAGRWVPRRGLARHPVAYVSFNDAEAYCRWLAGETGLQVRLPREEEWVMAAAAGDGRRKYPWGWGDPAPHAWFARAAATSVGRYEANAIGLHDMAGNVFEWCATDGVHALPEAQRPVRGGSWAETSHEMVAIANRVLLARGYRDADVGFRIIVAGDRRDAVASRGAGWVQQEDRVIDE